MKIYLDLVFFLNFMFDFLLLLTVKIVLKRNVKCYRILLGALVGAFSIFFLFIKLNSFTLFLLKIIISLIMLCVSFGFSSSKDFFKNFLYLYFISIVLGGFLYYLNLEFSYQNIGLAFFHNGFSVNFILLLILSPVIFVFYMKQDRTLKIIKNCNYQVDLYYQKKVLHYNAYLDTGNQLYDPYFHQPVILLYDPNFPKIKNPLMIPYDTLEHHGLLKCIRVDKIVLDQKKVILKPYIAFSNDSLKIEGVNMILHQDYLE